MGINTRQRGYSVVEGLIIVAFLAMVGIIISPAFVHAWESARHSRLDNILETMAEQIEQYAYDHGGRGPHLNERGELDTEGMIERLTGSTYSSGKVSKLAPCGPYMEHWPANPLCEKSVARSVMFGWAPTAPRDGTTGWYYNIETCEISSNAVGPADPVVVETDKPQPPIDIAILDRSETGLTLKGVFNGPNGMVAFIGDDRLAVGDKIDGAEVVEITWDSVVLKVGDERQTLRMKPREHANTDEQEAKPDAPAPPPASQDEPAQPIRTQPSSRPAGAAD